MLSTASSAVPRLTPARIIGRSITCKILIYKETIVNWTEGQACKKPGWSRRGLGGGAPRSCGGDGKNGRLRLSAHFDGRLEQLGERFDPRDEARPRTGELAGGSQCVYTAMANRRNRAPLFRKSHR